MTEKIWTIVIDGLVRRGELLNSLFSISRNQMNEWKNSLDRKFPLPNEPYYTGVGTILISQIFGSLAEISFQQKKS